jgi:hypothetical protein
MLWGARSSNLVCWGDSLTAGTGATSAATAYPAVLANAGARGRWFKNQGVGGDTSTQIRTRFFAAPSEYLNATTIFWAGRNNYTDGVTVKADIAAMVAALPHSRFLVASIINGNYATEYIGQPDYITMMALNSDLSSIYGGRYVDFRTPLVAAGAPAGIAPNPTDYANDIPPSGIRFDNLHLLDPGYAIVSTTAYAKLSSFGWNI